MEDTSKTQQKLPHQEFDYFKISKIIISRWYWIAASLTVCMIIGNTYLWYTPKTYATSATMKFEEKKSDVSDLVNIMSYQSDPYTKIQSEMYVLQSTKLILTAIKDLDYRISFYVEGRVRTSELYPEKPLKIKLIKFDSLSFYHGMITFKPVSPSTFNLAYNQNGRDIKRNYSYNEPVNINATTFSIAYPGDIPKTAFLFNFNAPEDFVGRVKGGLHIGEASKNSNIISLQQIDSNPQFAADILNALLKEYLNYDRVSTQQSATKTIHFINDQLDTISKKVRNSETALGEFKKESKIMDVSSSSQYQLTKANDFEAQRNLLKMQLSAIEQFKKQVLKEKDNLNPNFNIDGTANPLMLSQITTLNTLTNEKAFLLKTYKASSPQIEDINRQIVQIQNAIIDNVNLSVTITQKKLDYLDSQLAQVNQKISTFPLAERQLASLSRDFEINEKVYTTLKEKKQDAEITRSSMLPGATIVESAIVNMAPISPNESGIHRTAIFMGLLIGLGLIILIRILNPYIYDKETIESLTTIPIIGVIRKFTGKINENDSEILVLSQPKSVFAESVRAVRTNLSFLAAEKDQKVICITSEVAGEGKSFVSVNLASTLALIDKKVILVAADLRRSKLHKTFHAANDVGLSTFLSNQNTLDEVIIHTKQENLDFMPSGPVPPNPAELLHTEKMTKLINTLKELYDIVMIDTAPVGLVSDSIPLIREGDINVFVIRSGKSKFYAASIPQRIAQEYNLNNNVIILNAYEEDLLHSRYYTTKFNDTPGKYYYYSDYTGYESSGYYIEDDKKKWWDIRRFFKL